MDRPANINSELSQVTKFSFRLKSAGLTILYQVEYYEEVAVQKHSVSAQRNAYSAVLDCDVPKSDKEITISW